MAAVLAFFALGACSLAIDLDSLSNGVCPAAAKACDDSCVSTTDPNFGCASVGCAPCTLPNAVAICTPAGACALGACIGSFHDCDDNPANGCETDIDHDPAHCGGCMAPACVTTNGTPGCSNGVCATGACDPGYGDCNGLVMDGCETDVLTDSSHCGECMIACASGKTCQAGKCM